MLKSQNVNMRNCLSDTIDVSTI